MGDTTILKPEEDEKTFVYDGVPEEQAWFITSLFFGWEKMLFRRANKLHKLGRALEQEDLLPLPKWDHGDVVGEKFEKAWDSKFDDTSPSVKRLDDLKGDAQQSTKRLRSTIFEMIGPRFIAAGFIKMVNSALQFCFPILLNNILQFIEDTSNGLIPDDAPWHEKYRGYWLSALFFLAMGSKAITESAYFHRVTRCGYQAKVAVSMAVYNKSLRLTNAERQSTTLGTLNTYMKLCV